MQHVTCNMQVLLVVLMTAPSGQRFDHAHEPEGNGKSEKGATTESPPHTHTPPPPHDHPPPP